MNTFQTIIGKSFPMVSVNQSGKQSKSLSRELFVALKRVARGFGSPFEMDSARPFAKRFASDLDKSIRSAGFDIVIRQKCYEAERYTVQAID